MPINIQMPALSPTMEKGTLAKWLVKEGDTVKPGQILAEVETDKATMEYEAADEGIVAQILVAAGTEDVAVGTLIMVMAEEGESVVDVASAASSEPIQKPTALASSAPSLETIGSRPAEAQKESQAPLATLKSNNSDRIKASPLARRIATQMGIDLANVQGTGPGGRIVKADLTGAAVTTAAKTAPAPMASAAPSMSSSASLPATYTPPADVPYEEIKLPGMRKVIAKRMSESKSTVPHFYLTVDVELDRLMAVRKDLNAKLEKAGIKLSVNDFVIRACGLALKRVPDANAMYAGDKMYRFSRADISVAVAVPGGLVTPVIRGACGKGLAEISSEMKTLADKARDGKLMPEDYQGGTFSISNLGMFGIKQFDAVINPPQGAILAVGAGEQRPVVKDGALAIATVMSCTLSVDHRVLDGAIGAAFLAEFKKLLEEPLLMLA